MKIPGVEKVNTDQCEFGLSTTVNGEERLAKKPTSFATNSWCIAKELNRKCSGEHLHFSLMESRAAKAQEYPPEFCKAVCQGFQEQIAFDKTGMCSAVNLTTVELEAALQRVGAPGHWIDRQHEGEDNTIWITR